MEMEVFWLLVLAIMIVFELFTLGLVSIWFGVGAMAAEIATLLGAGIPLQVMIFFVTSILFIIFLRPFAKKYFNNNRTKTNIDSVIGSKAKVTVRIDNANEQGEVFLNGLPWMAREENNQIVEVGESVIVKKVSGVKLIVSKQ